MNLSPLTFLCALLPLAAQSYAPMTARERVQWFGASTFGVRSLLIADPAVSVWRTYLDRPVEWDSGIDGFGKRYASRVAVNTFTNSAEAGLGAIWKEDPRYFRSGEGAVSRRLGAAAKQIFLSRYGDGNYRFGAAKAAGIVGGSFVQKLWMPESVISNRDCTVRIGGNYGARFLNNLFREFGPDIRKIFKKR